MHPLDVLETVLARTGIDGVKRPLHQEAAQSGLANLAEFSAIRRSWWRATGIDLMAQLGGQVDGLGELGDALLVHAATAHGEVHDVPPFGQWEPGDAFLMFQERFKTQLVNSGLPSAFALGVVGAFNEMASNAIEHALSPLPPVATYEVRARWWAFSITDVGVGVLATLRRNPTYATLHDEVTALRSAVMDGVSGTAEAGRGFGFTQVFKSLAERACRIRFRTVGALATWDGVSPGAQRLNLTPMPARDGFHVAVGGSLPQDRA